MMALTTVLLLLSQVLLISSQVEDQDSNPMAEAEFLDGLGYNHVQQKLRREPRLRRGKRPKNVILFIGDGMGIATVTSYRIAKNQKLQSPYVQLPVYFETFPYSGLLKTHSYDYYVTDSAAGAVALLNGRKVDSSTLGMKPGLNVLCSTSPEDHIEGIADLAIEKGLAVGSVTTTRITHATPAALFAKGVHRNFEYDSEDMIESGATCRNDIAAQLLKYPAANFQYFEEAFGMRTSCTGHIDKAPPRHKLGGEMFGEMKRLRRRDAERRYNVDREMSRFDGRYHSRAISPREIRKFCS